jgi:hypothetical protein
VQALPGELGFLRSLETKEAEFIEGYWPHRATRMWRGQGRPEVPWAPNAPPTRG